jgi:hypothetical protein
MRSVAINPSTAGDLLLLSVTVYDFVVNEFFDLAV